jgi:quercetin dioxygenase-like cupin family protein
LQPGDSFDGEAHPMDTVEVLSVLSGSLSLRTGSAEPVLTTGDTVMFDAHAAHRYACVGAAPVRFTMVVLQPGDAGLVPPTSIAPAPPPE